MSHFLEKKYNSNIISDIDENKLFVLLNELIVSIINGIYRINNDTLKNECGVNYAIIKYSYITKEEKYDTNYIYFVKFFFTNRWE